MPSDSELTSLPTFEHRLIDSIKEWSGSRLLGDDCAVVPGGHLLTTDTLVQGTHFELPLIERSYQGFQNLGWKALAVNLSDVAAMAGRPRYALVSITVPEGFDRDSFRQIYEGLADCSRTYRTVIAGGDLTKGPVLSITIAILADVHESGCLLRSGAEPGDAIVVTGDFGASRAGLWLLQNLPESAADPEYSHCLNAHVRPQPRLCESWSMVRRTSSRGALMDTSDGLADALVQIARASGKGVGMTVDLERLPIDEQTKSVCQLAGTNPVDWALYGGEDYELVGCLPESIWQLWSSDNPFRKVGTVTDSANIALKYGARQGPELDLSQLFEQIDF